jgi:hypothetical protein
VSEAAIDASIYAGDESQRSVYDHCTMKVLLGSIAIAATLIQLICAQEEGASPRRESENVS